MPGTKCISKKELCRVLNFEGPNHIPIYKVKTQALSLDLPQWTYKPLLTTKRIHRNYIHTYIPRAIKIQRLQYRTPTLSPEIPVHSIGVEPIFNKLPKGY